MICPRALVFMSVAGALTGTHRDFLVVASFGQEPEIQCLVSRGQIVSTDLPLLMDGQTDRQTHNYNFIYMMYLFYDGQNSTMMNSYSSFQQISHLGDLQINKHTHKYHRIDRSDSLSRLACKLVYICTCMWTIHNTKQTWTMSTFNTQRPMVTDV